MLHDEDNSDSEDLDTIPAKDTNKAVVAEESEDEDEVIPDAEDDAEEGGDDAEEEVKGEGDEDEDEDGVVEYTVERIVTHDYSGVEGSLIYKVKWEGFSKEKDQTWEPKSNLLPGAKEALDEYHKKIGIVPSEKEEKTPATKGKGKRKSAATTSNESPAPASGRGRKRVKTEETNGKGKASANWGEGHVEKIISIDQFPPNDGKTKQPTGLRVYIHFNDGLKALFPMNTVRQKAPQKLLDYYENHLSFKTIEDDEGEEA